MLRVDEEEDDRGRLCLHVVVRHRRSTTVPGSDDVEPGLRERGDRSGGAIDRHRGGTVQDHEGG